MLRSRWCALALLPLVIPLASVWADPTDHPHVADELIIKFKSNSSQSERDAVLVDLDASHVKHMKRIKSDLHKIHGISVGQAIQRYKNHPKIEYIEPNYLIEATVVPNDPQFGDLWGMLNTGQTGGTPGADISATDAWHAFTGSSHVVIGVIDTGVDYTHPDLAANMWTNPGEIPNNGVDDDNNGFVDDVRGWDFYNDDNDPMDDNGHGTHVSGTIGAVGNNHVGVAGVCWNVTILPIKFLNSGGNGSTADAIDAVEYATLMGVRLSSNSWGGGGSSQALRDAIADAHASGILFVAAAGNYGSDTDVYPYYPASFDLPNIISVAATDHNDALAGFSNWGAVSVDLAAPGVDILSTFPGNSYGSINGTSMATPHVSGALGLIFGRFPAIGHLDAKNLVLNSVDALSHLSGIVATGGRLNAFMPIADPDSTPPGTIADLTVTAEGSNWLDVAWTATGDDSTVGTASRYVVQYSTTPIDDTNFDAALTAPNPPNPGAAGAPETMRITGLDFSTTYYVAVRVLDEFGNASDVSNSPSGSTLGVPDITAAPLSFTQTLLTGAISTQTLTLGNVGQGTLDFAIPPPQLITNAPIVAAYVNYGKGGADPRPGVLGDGGPDGFGYRWIDSDDPTGPIFDWTDISGTGTHILSSGDDLNVGPFPLGFTFPFYGAEYTEFFVCSNGWLSFISNSTAYFNQPIPNAGAPEALVAPFWDDLLGAGGDVYYEADATRVIVQWDNVPHFGSGGPYTFQAILYSHGTIEFQYLSIGSPDNSCTVGIQNAARDDGLQVVFNDTYVHDNLTVRIAAVPQWVIVDPDVGTIFAPNSQNLTVAFDATDLLGGTYEASIDVFSNDPDENPFSIPVQMTVVGVPDINLVPASVDFGPVFLGATPMAVLQVQNPGTGVLTVSNINVNNGVYSLSPTTFTVAPRSRQDVVITFAPNAVVSFPATVTVDSDDPDEPAATMTLSGHGVEPPVFAVTPASLSSDLFTGGTDTQLLTLSNSGSAELEWKLVVQHLHSTQLVTLTAPVFPAGADADGGVVSAELFRTAPIQAELADLTGVSILWDRGHAQPPSSGWSVLVADLTSRGATVTESLAPITPERLADYDVLWLLDSGIPWDSAEIATLVSWVNSGGGLLFEGDNFSTVEIFNELLSALGAGIVYSQTDGVSGPSSIVYPHPTTENVTEVYYSANVASIPTVTAPAEPLVDDASGVGAAAASQFGKGRVVAASDEVFSNGHIGLSDNQLFGNQVMDWLAGSGFASVDQTSGTVPPGGSVDLSVLFDATGLSGGHYEANLNIATNDPLAPQTAVPLALQVTGAPDVELDPASIDFGVVFLGVAPAETLRVRNMGTEVLNVSGISVDNGAYSFSATSFAVPPRAHQEVVITFAPDVVATYPATVTVHSDDPYEPTATVALAGHGVEPPVFAVTPDSLSSHLFTGDIETQTLTVSNTGGSDLLFWIAASRATADSVVVHGSLVLGRDDVDPRAGILGHGGPDVFGYQWVDSDEPGGPVFDWTDISSTGTHILSSGDDINVGPFPLGFTFSFYGVEYTEFRVCSNGWLSFTSTAVDYANQPLPNSGAPEALVAPFWDDLLGIGGDVYYQADGARVIVQWDNVPHYGGGGPYTFQAILYNNGTIEFQYLSIGSPDNSCTIGIQNAARDDGLQVVFNENYVHDSLAIEFSSPPSWLLVDPLEGVLPVGVSTPVAVTLDATGLYGGSYVADVSIASNDPFNSRVDVPVHLDVTGVPVLSVEPTSLDFGGLYIGASSPLTLTVSNEGSDVLSIASIATGLADYTVDVTSFDLDPFTSRDIQVTFTPQVAGDRSTNLNFVSNDPNSPHAVPLTGIGLIPPVASVTPASLSTHLFTNQIETQTLTLSNTGGNDLVFSITAQGVGADSVAGSDEPGAAAAPGWLSVDPTEGVVPAGASAPIAVTFDATGLFGGPYDAQVAIASNDPIHGLIDVPVHMDVTGIPILAIEPTSLDFGTRFIGYPESLNATITNEGTEVLSISSISTGLSDYTVDTMSMDLDPFASQYIQVTFDPQLVGDRSTALSIVSNDSNSPHNLPLSGAGLVPPEVVVSPDTIEAATLPGGSKSKTVSVRNDGGSDLVFHAVPHPSVEPVQVHDVLELPKGTDVPGGEATADPRPGILGTGGPDNFGYRWSDSDEPGGPTYAWMDLTGIGAPVGFSGLRDDANVGPVPIGFEFPFYGNTFNEIHVCSNGWLSFTNSTSVMHFNQPLPNRGPVVPENVLAVWWDDLVYDERDDSEVLYYSDGSRFIVQYYVRRLAQSAPPYYRFQVILYQNGDIVFQYHTLGPIVNSSTIGIQNEARDDGLTVVFNDGSYIHEEMAILFRAGLDWVSVDPSGGVVPAGQSLDISVNMDASNLTDGDHAGAINVYSNDPANRIVTSTAILHVGSIDAVDASIDPKSLNLSSNGNWITAQVELPSQYDPADVVIETVRLFGFSADPEHWSYDDDFNDNGIPDLTFKFDRLAIEEVFPPFDSLRIWVQGEIRDTIYFRAEDDVRLFRPHLTWPRGGEELQSGSVRVIAWEDPHNRSVDHADLFYSTDDGATWSEIALNVRDTRYAWIVPPGATEDGRVRVAIYDAHGILGFDSNEEPFIVTDAPTDAQDLPKVYALHQNVPNPFNPITTIHFDLVQVSEVQLRIYDVRGRVVEMLVNEQMPAGRHHVTWNGMDHKGRRVASGVYLYAIEAGTFRATRRMMVLK